MHDMVSGAPQDERRRSCSERGGGKGKCQGALKPQSPRRLPGLNHLRSSLTSGNWTNLLFSLFLFLSHTHIKYIYTHTQHRLYIFLLWLCFRMCVIGAWMTLPPQNILIFMFANNELEAYVLGFRLICSTIGANLDSRAENANFKGVFLVCTCCLFPPLRAQFLCRDDEF